MSFSAKRTPAAPTVRFAPLLIGALVVCGMTVGLSAGFPSKAVASTPHIEVADAQLTCSRIAKRCARACVKEAPETFCQSYCARERRQCLRTGDWSGMVRQFRDVRRK